MVGRGDREVVVILILCFIVCFLFLSFQVEAGNTGRVLALDAAAFLKKSGLPDLILGKVVCVYYN
jgi:p-aminobenzoyl-glutamate transporter AbgT